MSDQMADRVLLAMRTVPAEVADNLYAVWSEYLAQASATLRGLTASPPAEQVHGGTPEERLEGQIFWVAEGLMSLTASCRHIRDEAARRGLLPPAGEHEAAVLPAPPDGSVDRPRLLNVLDQLVAERRLGESEAEEICAATAGMVTEFRETLHSCGIRQPRRPAPGPDSTPRQRLQVECCRAQEVLGLAILRHLVGESDQQQAKDRLLEQASVVRRAASAN